MVSTSLLTLAIDKFWFAPQDAFIRAVEASIWSKQNLTPPVLDIGCGDGSYSQLLFKTQAKISVGTDINLPKKPTKDLKAIYQRLVQADAINLPFKKHTFSSVISNSTFEHINQDRLAVNQVARVLKSHGTFLMTVPNKRLKRVFARLSSSRRKLNRLNNRLEHLHYRSSSEWKKILAKAGLKLISSQPYFSPQQVAVWYRLFRISTCKIHSRELWSYLKDSSLGALVPKRIIKRLLVKYLRHHIALEFDHKGCWQFIIAKKI